jgi:deoxyribodipyrimidine photo-lyase
MTAIVWYRRDLRVHDHPALRAPLETDDRVVPVFCFDERLLNGRHRSGPRTQFLLECLDDLEQSLRRAGGGLVIRHGSPEQELVALAQELRADVVHVTAEVTPFARARDHRVREALGRVGVQLHEHPGLGVIDCVAAPRTQAGKPYTVFSPFQRSWEKEPRRQVLGAPSKLPKLPAGLGKDPIPSLDSLGLKQEVDEPPPGGEKAARRQLERFLADDALHYGSSHESLSTERTSRLSPYLHFGCVSAREAEERLEQGEGPDAFRRQLCWHDFYHHVLCHFPGNARSEFQQRYRAKVKWSHSRRRFEAWCAGRTGYPLVDAGMRQLRREGWMPNRLRLVVGSFLTKDLGINWRWGERHFMRLLVDGDQANNNGNWQWIASVGTDRQPASRRIYNPTRQMQTHDPAGEHVRRYVPELGAVPGRYIAEPWTMPAEVQREAGCLIGIDYPKPIVDHAESRLQALARYDVG